MTIGQMLRRSGDLKRDLDEVVQFLSTVEPGNLPKESIEKIYEVSRRLRVLLNTRGEEDISHYLDNFPHV